MKAEILVEVKKEIQKMLDAGFIRPCRYAEWIFNVVPVEKKNGRWRVAIDFRNLNSATPKDEYPMPVAETLINAAAGHKVLSFMDGNAGFISNLSGRIEPFMGLVKIKSDEEFRWGAEQQQAFDDIKEYLTKLPVLVPPQQDIPFYIYLSVADTSIASVVVQVYDGLEKVVFYLSRRMLDAETRISTPCTNNVAEYEAMCKGMELLLDAGAEAVEIFGDSKLVISQLTEDYKCESELLFPLWMQCRELMAQFRYINFHWIPRSQNTEVNDLAQTASGYKDVVDGADFQVQLMEPDDWRADIFNYLKDPARGAPKRIRYMAMKYVLIGDDMFYRTLEGLLLKCLGPAESNRFLHEVHEGACGTHQSAHKMKWLIRRSGFYWPTMLEDCFQYYKGCQACQKFGSIQMVPASAMNPIIKPWPFRGWGMDMIGKIHPPSSKGHVWVLAITDYFTKWVEAVPMKAVAASDVVDFVREHVIHRFGIPRTITTDGGSVFVSKEFRKFCEDMGIKLIRSSPYYAQANGQAEASNKSLMKLIKRKIDEHPRRWHEVLSEALWAYRMSCHGAIKTSPYHRVYGQEAVLPWEIKAGSRRVTFQNDLTTEEYAALMSDSIEDAAELRLWSLEKIKENKAKVARAYNKKVKPKEFQVGDLVWEAVLPLGTKDKMYGKWSPNWHNPYKVDQVLKGNAYMLEQLDGVKFPVLSMASISRSTSQACGMMSGRTTGYIAPSTTTDPILRILSMGRRALVVAVAAVSALLLVVGCCRGRRRGPRCPRPPRRVVGCRSREFPAGARSAWRRLVGGGVVLLFPLLLLEGGEVVPGEAIIIALLLRFPVGEEAEVTLSSVEDLSSSDRTEKSWLASSPSSRARRMWSSIGTHSGVGSREGEGRERPDEAEEEEEEDMVAEEGFWSANAKGMKNELQDVVKIEAI
ncbi:hypothetical protein QYE76_032952 [Lolium multiflorum]|uniref:Uncharacterized protein n=1 Tax=Lolium multiflorum TaxID=4521 RepID=A0AAD8QWJ3_LOLMU|nr:hypothetical protein QYE76_032952 [Lolium multiflorum]